MRDGNPKGRLPVWKVEGCSRPGWGAQRGAIWAGGRVVLARVPAVAAGPGAECQQGTVSRSAHGCGCVDVFHTEISIPHLPSPSK